MGLRRYTEREMQRAYLGGAFGGLLAASLDRHGSALTFWPAMMILIVFLSFYCVNAGRTGEWGYARKRTGARAANVS
jgi:hypothetical protein